MDSDLWQRFGGGATDHRVYQTIRRVQFLLIVILVGSLWRLYFKYEREPVTLDEAANYRYFCRPEMLDWIGAKCGALRAILAKAALIALLWFTMQSRNWAARVCLLPALVLLGAWVLETYWNWIERGMLPF